MFLAVSTMKVDRTGSFTFYGGLNKASSSIFFFFISGASLLIQSGCLSGAAHETKINTLMLASQGIFGENKYLKRVIC